MFKDHLEAKYEKWHASKRRLIGLILAVDLANLQRNKWSVGVLRHIEEMQASIKSSSDVVVQIEKVCCPAKQIRKKLKVFEKKEVDYVFVIGENEVSQGKVKRMKRSGDSGYQNDGMCSLEELFDDLV